MLNFVWFDRNKIFRNAIFLEKKIDFPMIWVGFATGSGTISSKVLWIRIQIRNPAYKGCGHMGWPHCPVRICSRWVNPCILSSSSSSSSPFPLLSPGRRATVSITWWSRDIGWIFFISSAITSSLNTVAKSDKKSLKSFDAIFDI